MSSALNLSNSIAYQRGKYVPFTEATVSIASSPFLYGLAIYTVFSANWNPEHNELYIFRLREHYDRLVTSARIMDFANFADACSFADFENIMLQLLNKNHAREDVLVRVMIYVDELATGTRMHGLKNDLAAFVYPAGEILPRSGARVMVSSWQRTRDNMIPSRAKINGSYVNTSLIKNEALSNGFDDAISLDTSGHVAEGTVANLFFVRGGTLLTPDTSTDILEGITRSTIITSAQRLHISVIERDIDRSELYAMDEAMYVGSSARITPILEIDHRPVGTGKPGATTMRLAEYYHKLQYGEDERHWLTPVYEEASSKT
jgi:branched-chain amino acid aminotransferase